MSTFATQDSASGTALDALKAELERFGAAHDAATSDRALRVFNITRDTGEFLGVLVRATAARRVLEIGTSNGYSTLWLAEAAASIGGSVTTVEVAEEKIVLALRNFARSGLSRSIESVHEDAASFLQRSAEGGCDLIFLDSERPLYPSWWPALRRALRIGGLLVVDNAISHREQMAPFVAIVTADPSFATCCVPVGKGEFVAVKTSTQVAGR
jgi:predicted O-methyltransferase YrrM